MDTAGTAKPDADEQLSSEGVQLETEATAAPPQVSPPQAGGVAVAAAQAATLVRPPGTAIYPAAHVAFAGSYPTEAMQGYPMPGWTMPPHGTAVMGTPWVPQGHYYQYAPAAAYAMAPAVGQFQPPSRQYVSHMGQSVTVDPQTARVHPATVGAQMYGVQQPATGGYIAPAVATTSTGAVLVAALPGSSGYVSSHHYAQRFMSSTNGGVAVTSSPTVSSATQQVVSSAHSPSSSAASRGSPVAKRPRTTEPTVADQIAAAEALLQSAVATSKRPRDDESVVRTSVSDASSRA